MILLLANNIRSMFGQLHSVKQSGNAIMAFISSIQRQVSYLCKSKNYISIDSKGYLIQ